MVWIITSQRYLTFRFDWKKYGKNCVIVFPLPRFSSTIQSEQVQCYNYQNYWGEDKTWTRGPWTPTLDQTTFIWTGSMDPLSWTGFMDSFFTSCQNAACSNGFFFWMGKLCFGGKRLTLSKCDFLPLISYWEVVKRILIFYLFLDVKLFIAAD